MSINIYIKFKQINKVYSLDCLVININVIRHLSTYFNEDEIYLNRLVLHRLSFGYLIHHSSPLLLSLFPLLSFLSLQ